jgi:hypothetical protein
VAEAAELAHETAVIASKVAETDHRRAAMFDAECVATQTKVMKCSGGDRWKPNSVEALN